MSRVFCALAAALAAGAVAAAAFADTQRIRAGPLSVAFTVATLRITDIQWFTARVIVRNRGKRSVLLDRRSIDFAQFALEFRGPTGAAVPHCPPPMPQAPRPLDEIEPGRRIGVDYRAEICIPLARGDYRVRFVYANEDGRDGAWVGGFASDWVRFELR